MKMSSHSSINAMPPMILGLKGNVSVRCTGARETTIVAQGTAAGVPAAAGKWRVNTILAAGTMKQMRLFSHNILWTRIGASGPGSHFAFTLGSYVIVFIRVGFTPQQYNTQTLSVYEHLTSG